MSVELSAVRRGRGRARSAVGLLLAVAWCSPSLHAQSAEGVRAQIEKSLPAAEAQLGKSALSHGAYPALQQVYAASGDAPLWSRDGRATEQARALLRELQEAENYGLRTQDYAPENIAPPPEGPARAPAASPEQLARFDVALSRAALRFICDLHFGRVTPEAAGFQLDQPRDPYDLGLALKSLASAPDMARALTAGEPAFYHYKLLKDALAHYRKMALEPHLTELPPIKSSVKVGDAYAGAAQLRHLLEVLGDLPPGGTGAAAEPTFDANLSSGVRSFQQRHGLTPDGALGKSTLAALQTPLARRIRQISLTLERWRWLTPFKTPPIIVNIPQFQLFAFRTTEDRVADILQMNVIVGRTFAHTQTPVFEKDMRYVVLRPYWDVPYSITKNEMLPKMRANPRYLAAQHLEIVNGQNDSSPVVPPTPENIEALAAGKLRLRQQPGEDNALGLAKFLFPNSYNVYLHSTPAHRLFQESVRTFSHGCIRVADPLALATLVLKDAPGDWTPEKIQAAMNGTRTIRVNLTRPINVLILYATALATEAGPMLFFDDIYGYDKKLEGQLGLAPVR
jgi:murein L,D-transpeptidase YcbB/YkuD